MNQTIFALALLFAASAFGQSVPKELIADDLTATSIAWTWTRVKGTNDALGFRIYCGDANNNSQDGTIGYYTEMEQVADKTARSYLIWPMLQALAKREGAPQPPLYDNALHLRCKVVAYNATGDSEDSLKGIPSKPSNIKFVRN